MKETGKTILNAVWTIIVCIAKAISLLVEMVIRLINRGRRN